MARNDEEKEQRQREVDEARGRDLRIKFAKEIAAGMRGEAARILGQAATTTDAVECEARLAVGNGLIRVARRFEKGDIGRGENGGS